MTSQNKKYAVFTHQLLPGLFFRNPSSFVNTIETNGTEYLMYLWKNLAGYSADFDTQGVVPFATFNFTKQNIKFIVIEFEVSADSDCVAIGFSHRAVTNLEHGIERVFTAEKSKAGTNQIELFEWDKAMHNKIKSINNFSIENFFSEIFQVIR